MTKKALKLEPEVYSLLKQLCPDFEEYHYLKHDQYKGPLFGKYNIYIKTSSEDSSILGIVTGKRNIEKYNLSKFVTNFETIGSLSGEKEKGWSGKVMNELLHHLKSLSS